MNARKINVEELIDIKLQMKLNQHMYNVGKLPYSMYSKANEVLTARMARVKESIPQMELVR